MGKGTTICLAILFSLTILNVFAGNSFTGVSETTDIDYEIFVNGSSTTLSSGEGTLILGIDSLQGAIIWFFALMVIVGVITFQVLGSGLGETGQKTARTGLIATGVWGILSVLAWNLLTSIPTFGTIIWTVLTIIYAVDIFYSMGRNG